MNQEQVNKYLDGVIHPLFQKLLVDVIKEKPKRPMQFCKTWFEKEVEACKGIDSDCESDKQSEEELQRRITQRKSDLRWYKPRKAICGQVFGNYHKRIEFEPKIVKKKPTVNSRILFRLKSIFLFKDLDDKDTQTLINAMQEERYEEAHLVIQQGELGEAMYIVDEGQLTCSKMENEREIFIKNIVEGDFFGELSLMYNTARQANVRVKNRTVLFKLSRNTFNSVVRDRNMRKRKIYSDVLQRVDIFKELEHYQRVQLQDVAKEMLVHPNEYVIREGKVGNSFFIIEEGSLVALKRQKNGHEKVVFNYKEGDFFGELALMTNQPRQASVMSITNSRLVYIEREAFERVIGPIAKILERSIDVNKKYRFD